MHLKSRRPGLPVLLLLFFQSLPSLADTKLNQWQSADYIEKAFVEIALKNEYQQTDFRLLKWEAPIRYVFQYHGLAPNPMIENLFEVHLKQLQQITQHPIEQVENADDANLKILLTQDQHYRADIARFTQSTIPDIERNSHCMGSFKTGENGAIINAVVILPVDHIMSRGLLPACVVEETTQLLGLPNDSDWVAPSIANDSSKLDLLTGLDYLFLKILYSPELKAGMPLDQSLPIIRARIQKLTKDGTVKNAQRNVNQQGLYPILY
ncbi:DUF2927 domain-containing protein [Thiomicrorhabdus chilensis]|uniref:DUF2927 domain-containing protein n=1 Tax=Thiomicrorhabdus chilensis TaxID=63656 RepID=UPI00040877DB|nr:DUF2927 domain-containing protein [Thiomicrorhabdus chilensis]